mmetsp:Transcript_15744/g.15882  ORF Transcript_15744/g.15882 Transcript_15744/m.15882 type:complete len:342 (-) Transcript_15744:277-1302(-)|eukprot:CAMPEP_0182427836 /NCGR_PEP_ID=MMETSP1167-20130531/20163_1 /TAXON_ID=2988 /ORGANISM="Mallomonas Sp, Strain CCMP3275" /LENGTH=341 /DNA_ID=CAMNT_0024610375 /DNA_START=103 /DNA_END=1128 /DNA_ORIENTATION=+
MKFQDFMAALFFVTTDVTVSLEASQSVLILERIGQGGALESDEVNAYTAYDYYAAPPQPTGAATYNQKIRTFATQEIRRESFEESGREVTKEPPVGMRQENQEMRTASTQEIRGGAAQGIRGGATSTKEMRREATEEVKTEPAIVARTMETGSSSMQSEQRSSQGIQYMITQRMRRVLESDLDYLPTEVDVMSPEVAAVVIERHLARPSTGMPASWRRKHSTGQQMITTVKKAFSEAAQTLSDAKNRLDGKHSLPVLGLIGGIFLLHSHSHTLSLLPNLFLRGVSRTSRVLLAPVSRLRRFRRSHPSPRVDMFYLEAMHHPSLIETVQLRAVDVKRRLSYL